jgi:hypothetical protein
LEWRARTSAADRSNQDRVIGQSSPVLSVGDLVLVKFHKQQVGKIKKLSPKQQGPYIVIAIRNESIADLQHCYNANDRLL